MPMKFKTEEDKAKAIVHFHENLIEDTSQIPEGKDVDKYVDEQAQMMEDLEFAEIDAEAPAWAPPEGEKKGDLPPQTPPAGQTPPQTPPADPPPADPPPQSTFELDNLRRSADRMKGEYESELKKRDDQMAQMKAEFDQKLKDLKPAAEPKPAVDADLVRNIQEKALELKNINMDIDNLDEYDENFAKLMKRQTRLRDELDNLREKKNTALIEESNAKLKAIQEASAEQAKKMEADAQARKEKEELEAKRKAEKERQNQALSRIESFRSNIDELKEGRPFVEMESDYLDFSKKLAAVCFDKSTEEVTVEDRDLAYAKFAKKVPVVLEAVQAAGIKPPEDLEKYIMLSDINSIYSGEEFDYDTGQWRELTNDLGKPIGMPSMKAAYNFYLEKTGKTAEQLLKRERESIASFQQASQTRAGAVELTREHQQSAEGKLTAEVANQIVMTTDENMIMKLKDKGKDMNEAEKALVRKFDEALALVTQPA